MFLSCWMNVPAVWSLSHAQLFAIPWTAAHKTFLSFNISWNFLKVMSNVLQPYRLQHTRLPQSFTNSLTLLKVMSFESVMPSNHLILCRPLLLPSSIFPSIRVFSNESSSHQVAKVLEFQLQHQSFQ